MNKKPYFGDVISTIKKISKLLGVAIDPSPFAVQPQELERNYGIHFEFVYGVMCGHNLLKTNDSALKLFEDKRLLFQSNEVPSDCINPHGMVFGNLKVMLMALSLLLALRK